MSKLLKFTIIFILFTSIVFMVSKPTLATYNITFDTVDSMKIPSNIPVDTVDSMKISSNVKSTRIFGIIHTILTITSIVSLPVCITLGTIYLVKSKSKPAKKITLGILIILIPIILFILSIAINYIRLINSI